MTQQFAEILLFIPILLTAGFVFFLPSVIQKMMNDLDGAEFKRFLTSLVEHSLGSPYGIGVSITPFIGMIPYWIYFRLDNLWFSAGLVMWIITSAIAKQTRLPIYSRVTGRKFPGYKTQSEIPKNDEAELKKECRKLQKANYIQALFTFISVILMTIGFY